MKMQMRLKPLLVKSALVSVAFSVLSSSTALALPFNTDMYDPQPMTGEVMRPKAPNSVPMGSLDRRLESKEAALKLQNPLRGDPVSVESGQRLFAINCAPCHGTYGVDGAQTPSWFASQVGAPDLTASTYWEESRSDGNIYGTIHLGGMAIMPAYGWKLSPTEHWDIVNYVRSIQAAKKKTSK
jgi:mono/diheme cytochrome c family protein